MKLALNLLLLARMVTHYADTNHTPRRGLHRLITALGAIAAVALVLALATPAAAFIDVTDYGAKGDGSDATAAINAAIDAAGPNGDTVYLPAGSYAVNATIVVTGKRGLRIVGDGVGATQLLPNGLGGKPVLQFVNDVFTTVESLTINGNSQSPPSAGIESDAAPNGESTRLTVRDVTLGSPSSNNLVDGIRFGVIGGADAMNDQGFFENVNIINFSHAAYSFLGHNSLVHTIVGGQVEYGPIGVYSEGGTFKISGTHFQTLSDVIFDFENSSDPGVTLYQHPILINAISTESASNLLRTGTVGMYVAITGCDFNSSASDGPYIDWNSPGMLFISDSFMYYLQPSEYLQFNAGIVNLNSNYFNLDKIVLNGGRLNSHANCWGGPTNVQSGPQAALIDSGDSCNPLVTPAPAPAPIPDAVPSKFCRNHKHSRKCG
ncbi:MAG: glycosyl hydrolase family 28-related protein [Candidatus Binataceae bacterium]